MRYLWLEGHTVFAEVHKITIPPNVAFWAIPTPKPGPDGSEVDASGTDEDRAEPSRRASINIYQLAPDEACTTVDDRPWRAASRRSLKDTAMDWSSSGKRWP